MPRVNTVFSSDDRDVIKTFQRMQAENTKYRQQLAATARESKAGADQTNNSLAKGIGQLAGMVSGYKAVAAAARIVTDEIRTQINLRQKQADASTTLADAEIKALRNLGNATNQERQKLRSDIAKISKETGVSQKDLFLAASEGLSARGNLPVSAVIQSLKAGAQLAPESADELRVAAGAALDLAKTTGSSDAKENLGFLLNVGQRSRVTNVQSLGQAVLPAIAGVQAFGGSKEEAASLVAAFTQATADPTGKLSGTASISFAEQLRAFSQERGIEGTLSDRIAALQGNEKLRNRFLKGLSLEKRALPFAEQLLTDPNSGIAKEYAGNLAALPGLSGADTFENIVGGYKSSSLQQVAAIGRLGTQAEEALLTGDPKAARQGALRKAFEKQLDSAGITFLQGREGLLAGFEAASTKGGADQAFDASLKVLIKYLQEGTESQKAQVKVVQQTLEEFRRTLKQRPTYVQRPE